MGIKIVTDSASDIRQRQYDMVTVLPMHISFGENTYEDGVNLSPTEFYEKLIESDDLPQTAQVSPYDFEKAFSALTKQGHQVIAITLSSQLSGTYQSACIAASEFDEKVTVIDSESATIGEHALVRLALQMIEDGASLEEIVSTLEEEKKNIHIVAMLDTLEYLKKGGRISKSAAAIGSMLSIKPVITLKDGVIEVMGKARGSKNGHNLLMESITAHGGIDFQKPYFFAYTGLSNSHLQKYIQDSKHLWEQEVSSIEPKDITFVGATIGTHIGPGAIACVYFSKS